jgi:TM2 domain-containing membrane protein YozV
MQMTPEKEETPSSEKAGHPAEAKLEKGKKAEDRIESDPVRPIIAAVLSLVFAGLGHFYLRKWGRGVSIFFVAAFLFKISGYAPRAMMLNVALFVFSAFDAYSFGKRGFGIF